MRVRTGVGEQPHLNQMLRQELAHYTRAAIIVTVAEAERTGTCTLSRPQRLRTPAVAG